MSIPTKRIHILGASGSGTTTFGRELANAMSAPSFDTDDFYWIPTNPPFVDKRSIPDRIRIMEELFLQRPKWVLSGSLTSWSGPLIPYFDHVIFLSLDDEVRMKRLRENRKGVKALTSVSQSVRSSIPVRQPKVINYFRLLKHSSYMLHDKLHTCTG